MGVRWLKRIMVVAARKLTVKGLMGRMFTYRSHIYKSLEYISPHPRQFSLLEECVLIWTWPRINRALWMLGRLPIPAVRVSSFLPYFLPWVFCLLLEQPGLACCVSICWHAVWTKAGSLPEELKSHKESKMTSVSNVHDSINIILTLC